MMSDCFGYEGDEIFKALKSKKVRLVCNRKRARKPIKRGEDLRYSYEAIGWIWKLNR